MTQGTTPRTKRYTAEDRRKELRACLWLEAVIVVGALGWGIVALIVRAI